MAELLLSAFFQALFDKLASRDLANFVSQLRGGVDSELRKLENTLKMIQAVLRDAEEKEVTSETVKLWLDNLRDLAYDAEDVLDEFDTEALRQKSMADQASTCKLKNLVPSCFNISGGFNSSRMLSKIESISNQLEQLFQTRAQLGLQTTPGGTSASSQEQQRQANATSSVPEEPAVYGRDEDKAKILDMVLSDGSTDANFHVISIIGMPGVGKTKLAQEVYNDEAVEIFDIKAWLCVSDDFNVFSISKTLLAKITSKPFDVVDIDEVQVQLKKAVAKKRFLLVLDDVWNENYNSWSALKAPFITAAPKSKMIVTTRNSSVASTMGAVEQYNLKPLSNKDCWSIFMMHAYEGKDINAVSISESFRKKVVAKCGGLPLAAKTLGGLLRSKGDDEWDEILNSSILDLPQSGILSVLRLSYHYLPSHLKRCFAYCAILPKDYEIEEKELVSLWMAEGIIQQSRNNSKQPEVLGREYFQDLLSRSILQPSSSNTSKFVMHDLVHDLARWVSGDTSFRWEEANKTVTPVPKVRHFAYDLSLYVSKGKFEVLHEVQHLRTFLPLSISSFRGYSMNNVVFSDLLPRCVKLRVLSFTGHYINEFPTRSMSGLKHLRYLNLSATWIRKLPESVCSLINLQILLLRSWFYLRKLPSNIRKLINLRRLDIMGACLIKEMPFGIKELKNLQVLSNFIVGTGTRSSGLKDLKRLTLLNGELCISRLENVNDPREAKEAALWEKKNLETLSLLWRSKFDSSRREVLEESVLDVLKPYPNIKKLTIMCYGGQRFPSWIGDPSFSVIEVLKLENCEHCTSLPSLGLLSSLKHLTVKGLTKLKSIGIEVYGKDCSKSFQSLKILRFENLPEWEHWDTEFKENGLVAGFSNLRQLSIVKCPKFSGKSLEHLPSLGRQSTTLACLPEEILGKNSQLESLYIQDCHSLRLIARRKLSSSLKSLKIRSCQKLQQLVDDEEGASSSSSMMLKHLEIRYCPQLTSFSSGTQLLEALEVLHVSNCPLLESIPGGLHNIQSINIEDCANVVSLAERGLPNTISCVKIWSCEKLEALPNNMHKLHSLQFLEVRRCPSLVSLAERGLPITISRVFIEDCEKLKALPDNIHKLNSLQFLEIRRCPSIVSFPEEGFPASLKSLVIGGDVKMYEALIQWGLHKLTSLRRLLIAEECHEAECFPDEEIGMTLPTPLIELQLWGLSKLKLLSSTGFQCLTSLEYLCIQNCLNLTSFPEVGLPSSLLELKLIMCPMLEKECKRNKGKEWSKIANIPRVVIDGEIIYTVE
ncbi:putative disease resistance RPP13-like protein 1 [Citrus sinensis]|uniref:putative disease resistance RPP13-like protein 1 isoform X1 n=1 Tax=Citrus sinensis TaxID=2711 RepID=UPI00218D0B10|nr:putative disease resistance RPP13-like protein 1 isoform X1 [Citrus sinensis]XP_052292694.1 putative disease resistance RPP13-like protein 1 isoform X1 [Citrus sinensis]XP_052292696.1 putative disease resistance RPP13-like protein 1 isoform X1 [Citrus sinensis]XP_052292697.1 putative disease resistance RPP13-like protein 1 isoform X1 [Citrus sinensis]XP_052292698.1 putative disease resistance RPP13-like protein 1 isoform X1 [Citrus sinensis]XP_052292699.1 putative disease resistance RPP13-l